MRRLPIRGLLTFRAIDTLKKKGAAGIVSLPWYTADMTKPMTISEFARLGGKARAEKLTKEQLSAIGKKGGRPRKKLEDSPLTAGNSLQSHASTKQARRDKGGVDKENFYRVLHRATSSPSTSRKSALDNTSETTPNT